MKPFILLFLISLFPILLFSFIQACDSTDNDDNDENKIDNTDDDDVDIHKDKHGWRPEGCQWIWDEGKEAETLVEDCFPVLPEGYDVDHENFLEMIHAFMGRYVDQDMEEYYSFQCRPEGLWWLPRPQQNVPCDPYHKIPIVITQEKSEEDWDARFEVGVATTHSWSTLHYILGEISFEAHNTWVDDIVTWNFIGEAEGEVWTKTD